MTRRCAIVAEQQLLSRSVRTFTNFVYSLNLRFFARRRDRVRCRSKLIPRRGGTMITALRSVISDRIFFSFYSVTHAFRRDCSARTRPILSMGRRKARRSDSFSSPDFSSSSDLGLIIMPPLDPDVRRVMCPTYLSAHTHQAHAPNIPSVRHAA